MWRIRLFEEQAEYQSSQGKVMGALHTYIGEEAVAVPVCAHLRIRITLLARTAATRPLHCQGRRYPNA